MFEFIFRKKRSDILAIREVLESEMDMLIEIDKICNAEIKERRDKVSFYDKKIIQEEPKSMIIDGKPNTEVNNYKNGKKFCEFQNA